MDKWTGFNEKLAVELERLGACVKRPTPKTPRSQVVSFEVRQPDNSYQVKNITLPEAFLRLWNDVEFKYSKLYQFEDVAFYERGAFAEPLGDMSPADITWRKLRDDFGIER